MFFAFFDAGVVGMGMVLFALIFMVSYGLGWAFVVGWDMGYGIHGVWVFSEQLVGWVDMGNILSQEKIGTCR